MCERFGNYVGGKIRYNKANASDKHLAFEDKVHITSKKVINVCR